jgi:flagellar L-ring protein FlgH
MKCSAMRTSSFNLVASLALGFVLFVQANAAQASKKKRAADPAYAPTAPAVAAQTPSDGAIFSAQTYAPLTSGNKAAKVGDLVTIILAERTDAAQSSGTSTAKDGSFGLTPPGSGPFSVISPDDLNFSGEQSFKGKGDLTQSNSLNGEISVTVAEVYPNGTMLLRGEKLIAMNRGDEKVQLSGIVRLADISADNRVLSSRIADARVLYLGQGDAAKASKPGWLARFFAIVNPF